MVVSPAAIIPPSDLAGLGPGDCSPVLCQVINFRLAKEPRIRHRIRSTGLQVDGGDSPTATR